MARFTPMPLVIISNFYTAKYNHGEAYARRVAAQSLAMLADDDEAVLSCIFPDSMLDLVPSDRAFYIVCLGRAFAEQGLDEEAFMVSNR